MSAEMTPAIERAERALVEAWHGTIGRAFHPTRVKEARATVSAALDVEEMAEVFIEHAPSMWSSGEVECRCGEWKTKREGDDWMRPTHEFRGESYQAHAGHVAAVLRTALLGADS